MATPQISATSTATREPLVVTKRQVRTNRGLKKVNSILPAHHAGRRFHSNVCFTQNFSIPSGFFQECQDDFALPGFTIYARQKLCAPLRCCLGCSVYFEPYMALDISPRVGFVLWLLSRCLHTLRRHRILAKLIQPHAARDGDVDSGRLKRQLGANC